MGEKSTLVDFFSIECRKVFRYFFNTFHSIATFYFKHFTSYNKKVFVIKYFLKEKCYVFYLNTKRKIESQLSEWMMCIPILGFYSDYRDREPLREVQVSSNGNVGISSFFYLHENSKHFFSSQNNCRTIRSSIFR